jgi:hypothetical protein
MKVSQPQRLDRQQRVLLVTDRERAGHRGFRHQSLPSNDAGWSRTHWRNYKSDMML